jgi:hypothetical protein
LNKLVWAHLRINKETIPKKVLNLKVKGKCPRGRLRSTWEQQVRKYITHKEGRSWEETEEQELWESRVKWRLGCWMNYIKWTHLKKKNA